MILILHVWTNKHIIISSRSSSTSSNMHYYYYYYNIIYYCLGHSFTSETFFVFFLIVNKVLTMFQTSPSGFPPSLPPSIVSGNSVSSPPSLLRKVTQLGPDMSYGGLQNKITNINRNSSLYKICQAINLMCMMAKAVS